MHLLFLILIYVAKLWCNDRIIIIVPTHFGAAKKQQSLQVFGNIKNYGSVTKVQLFSTSVNISGLC